MKSMKTMKSMRGHETWKCLEKLIWTIFLGIFKGWIHPPTIFCVFFFNWQGVNQRTMDHWILDQKRNGYHYPGHGQSQWACLGPVGFLGPNEFFANRVWEKPQSNFEKKLGPVFQLGLIWIMKKIGFSCHGSTGWV
jgi:hypothetical protein